jgi:hypothetical protein
MFKMLVAATDPRVRNFDEDLVASGSVLERLAFDDAIVGGTFEYGEFDAHVTSEIWEEKFGDQC